MNERVAGVLMPVFSLPSKYGIGDFSVNAYKWVDFLKATRQKYWQVLPLGMTSMGDSPYQSPSNFAGNPYFISIDKLLDKGLLTWIEARLAFNNSTDIDYGWLFNTRYELLNKAFNKFKPNIEYDKFIKDNQEWLEDYALFMALKVDNNHEPWYNWSDDYKFYDNALKYKTKFNNTINFYKWIQFEFYTQWTELKQYANNQGILIIGDRPLYASLDSVDVWANPKYYYLDNDLKPIEVAGCPPDDFTPDGQLWGNPLYRWGVLANENFSYLLKSYKASFKLFDCVRIDHFRGLSSYYSINATEHTARNGHWVEAKGIEFITELKASCDGLGLKDCVIAEDLGFIEDKVRQLLEHSEYPGMKVFQFSFGGESERLDSYPLNSVAYVGTHDNLTLLQWIDTLTDTKRQAVKDTIKDCGWDSFNDNCIQALLNTKSIIAIVSIQDYLGLKQARINTPGTMGGNWSWRLDIDYDTPALRTKIINMTTQANRKHKNI